MKQARTGTLDGYYRKRDFRNTPEPKGTVAPRSGKRLMFCVQRHAARRLHYDFRLELDGALKSWAVPKGPSLDPHEKRLAVHVEDHPLDYGKFEGVIPEGNYGAGRVVLWDLGTWTPEGDARAAYAKGSLAFRLDGEKLKGSWRLVRMRCDGHDKHDNWLLIKHGDEAARVGRQAEITTLHPNSVKKVHTPRSKDARVSHGGERAAEKATRARVRRGNKGPLPSLIAPQLATLVETPPAAGNWLYEIKYDGYRMLARIEAGEARLYSRNGHDWTGKLGGVASALSKLETDHTWLDGEVWCWMHTGFRAFRRCRTPSSAAVTAVCCTRWT